MLKVPGDVIVLPESGKRWVVYNVFTRTALGVDDRSLAFLREAETDSAEEPLFNSTIKFNVWDIWDFTNFDCIVDDPTHFIRDTSKWPEQEEVAASDLIGLFKKYWLLIDDEDKYISRFATKDSMTDDAHFGDYRQELAQEIDRRLPDTGDYWMDQKFTSDRRSIKNNLYKSVQENYLKDYFKKKVSPGHLVLDLGCGIGHYANMIAGFGADVLGFDPNPGYIEIANQNAVKGAKFELRPLGVKGALDDIGTQSVDFVFMSDSFIHYYVPDIGVPADIEVLLNDIHRILKKDGLFVCCDPHHIFLYQPWLGSKTRPFTVVTEYLERKQHITPTMSWHVQACAKGNFAVTWMEELTPDSAYEKVDPRGYHFAKEFPIWMFYEMKPT